MDTWDYIVLFSFSFVISNRPICITFIFNNVLDLNKLWMRTRTKHWKQIVAYVHAALFTVGFLVLLQKLSNVTRYTVT